MKGPSARVFKRIHGAATACWAALAIPTVWLWSGSVGWINAMSWYANVASHGAAYQAARADTDSSRSLLWIHGAATVIWLLLGIPTLLWWNGSVTWLAVQSCWANIASHWGAYAGSRAEDNNH